ncbi:hypothetical protein [Mycobacterium intracellulare]|uniref:hypothetical protein n=1 Tax=Mycobacterium intracellulare TaxID=1767 RepID=UPI00109E985F|nr:hypothetical protein [Mycobacterium intracellulare]
MLAEHAEEIEADLYYRGIDIFDWYQGRISDRRMLALIKHLPEDSAFKTAARDDWPLEDHLAAATVNSINALRADMFPGTAYKPILAPSVARHKEAQRAQVRAAHDELITQMRGKH